MITRKGEASYTLRIAGRDYTLTSADSPEHVKRVAVYVDRKIAETGSSGFVNREGAAVIATGPLTLDTLAARLKERCGG